MAIKRKTIITLMAASAAMAAGATTVQAAITDNMYPTGNYSPKCRDGDLNDTFCQTDNKTLTIYREGSLSSSEKTTISRSVKDYYGPTDLAVKVSTAGVYSGSSETDIIYKSKNMARTTVGVTWCNDATATWKCDQHYIAFNSNHSTIGPINKWYVCHETGHAVGLTHGPDANPAKGLRDPRLGCMSYDPVYSLGTNNRDNINSTY